MTTNFRPSTLPDLPADLRAVAKALATRLGREIPTTRAALCTLGDSLRTTDRAAFAALGALSYGDAPGAAGFLGLRACHGAPAI